jgi:hypothetical protein
VELGTCAILQPLVLSLVKMVLIIPDETSLMKSFGANRRGSLAG